jgi:hypothetical protein
MGKHNKLIEKILDGTADNNISLRDLCSLLKLLDSMSGSEVTITFSAEKMWRKY